MSKESDPYQEAMRAEIEQLKSSTIILQSEVDGLRSRVQGLRVNRDALFEENKRFRAELDAKTKRVVELRKIVNRNCADKGRVIDEQSEKIEELERIVVEAKECVQSLQTMCDTRAKQIKELRSELDEKVGEANRVITQQACSIRELKSELERRMDDASEAIYQLELKIRLAKEARANLRIEIVQQSGKIYFWSLMREDRQLAHSREINMKGVIEPEADEIAAQLGLPVVVNERR